MCYSWSKRLKGWVKVRVDDLLAYMDENNIDLVWLLPLPGRVDPFARIIDSEHVLRVAREYPDRIIPFCVIDPRNPKALEKLKRFHSMDFRGFGEFKVKLRMDDPRSIKLYKLCGELQFPVLIHMDNTYNPDIKALEHVLEEIQDTIFILHGPGWWKHISAKVDEQEVYPRGKVIPGGLVERLLEKYDNLYADISAYSGYNALERDPGYAKEFLERFADKILFGTDFPCIAADGSQFGPNRSHIELLERLRVDSEAMQKILHKNALKILRD